MDEGGIMGDARNIYIPEGAAPREPPTADFRWQFPGGRMSIKFAALPNIGDERKHMGPEYGMVGFDQLERFQLRQFTYLFTRARAGEDAGYIPFVRITVNPVHRSDIRAGWIRDWVDYWIDEETGYPIPERRGEIRHFVRAPKEHDQPFIVGEKDDLLRRFPNKKPVSMTFIHGERADNPYQDWDRYDEMLGVEEDYVRQQLQEGNWNVGPTDATKIWELPHAALFEDDDLAFQTLLRSGQPLEWIGMWDYGRSAKALAWNVGILAPGSPPTLWMVASKVWESADAVQAAKDREGLLEHLAASFGVSISRGDVRDAGDPSGEYRSGPGESWGQALRAGGVPLVNVSHIVMGKDQRQTFLNSDYGFTVRTKLVQQWLNKGQLRIRNRSVDSAALVQAVREWALDVPEGMSPIDVNRQFLRPTKGRESHVGDALTYGVAFAYSIVRGRRDHARPKAPPRTEKPKGYMGGGGLRAP